ncbi:vitamin B12 dependent-methionine synthase activation domain-containing protein [Promethearchaeum syntrophicum]|uniref:Vitamin B12 dependent-methionine synthase activation domain-containing protein n=1 Tax=Promethearchaeum syntrophicum TaxID=2594042 RepID=A0A5B9D6D8_9ARCH|nr:vitamin B12 dependent-methionine synthase activation domain-containing protein [Candidatus Prometheoarchaeum syntrophicum]QEE14654.1 Vitamin B12 dependent methionine synthase, activation domain [Candidatus Prometheoarchaeum syntrophicum]
MNIEIDKKEILRYLGGTDKNNDQITDQLIDESIEEVRKISVPKFQYRIFEIKKNQKSIQILNSILVLTGKDIIKHLIHSKKVAIMAVTLGIQVDRKIKYYSNIDLTKAVIFDACATTYIEAISDNLESEIKEIANQSNCNLTYRFSPGYGDFSLKVQDNILKVLNSSRTMGLTVSNEHILVPSKSVTAIIGFEDKNIKKPTGKVQKRADNEKCKTCLRYKNCIYLQEGTFCEFRKKNL